MGSGTRAALIALAMEVWMNPSPHRLTFVVLFLTVRLPSTAFWGKEAPSRIYLVAGGGGGRFLAYDPSTGERSEVFAGCDQRPRVSPDGRSVAYTQSGSVW